MINFLKLIRIIIKGWALWVWFYLSPSYHYKRLTEATNRINICEDCETFNKTTRICTNCSCFMDIKTKMEFKTDKEGISIDGCPEHKW